MQTRNTIQRQIVLPVSYTHLAVYKRQAGHSNCRRRVRPNGAAPFLHRKAGVSELR